MAKVVHTQPQYFQHATRTDLITKTDIRVALWQRPFVKKQKNEKAINFFLSYICDWFFCDETFIAVRFFFGVQTLEYPG